MTATTVKSTTRETVVSEINDILDRSTDWRTIDEYVWRVRAFLTMNNYELWPDEDIAALVKETVDPDWLEIPSETKKTEPQPAEKKKTLQQPAKRIRKLLGEEYRIYRPAPVVVINRQGCVRWNEDGRQHKAGDPILPRSDNYGRLTVRFRYNGKQYERAVGAMLVTVGFLKGRKRKKKPSEGVTPSLNQEVC